MTVIKILLVMLLCMATACALYPQIYKSKAYNLHKPGVDAFAITLDTNNVLYVWREIDGVAVEVANIENWCEPVVSQ